MIGLGKKEKKKTWDLDQTPGPQLNITGFQLNNGSLDPAFFFRPVFNTGARHLIKKNTVLIYALHLLLCTDQMYCLL